MLLEGDAVGEGERAVGGVQRGAHVAVPDVVYAGVGREFVDYPGLEGRRVELTRLVGGAIVYRS